MPITYDFPFNRATELNSRPLKQTRYNFTISNTVDDPWDSRFVGPVLNPPFISNHPIDIRLLSPLVTAAATWDTGDGTNSYKNTTPSIIPTDARINIPSQFDGNYTNILNPDLLTNIGTIPTPFTSEINALVTPGAGGVQMYSNGISSRLNLSNPSTGGSNSLDVTNLVSVYRSQIRSQGTAGFTLAMMIMGHNPNYAPIPGSTMNESNYVTGPDSLGASPFNQEFYRTSSYFAFNSANSPIPATRTIVLSNVATPSIRKDAPYRLLNLSLSSGSLVSLKHNAAIVSGSVRVTEFAVNPSIQSDVLEYLNWCNARQGSLSINRYSPEETRVLREQGVVTFPSQLYCSDHNGGDDGAISIRNISSTGVTFSLNVASANALFDDGAGAAGTDFLQSYFMSYSGSPLSTPVGFSVRYGGALTSEPFKIRFFPGETYGNKSIICLQYTAAGNNFRRLFRSSTGNNTNNIGITAGSYIRLTAGASPANQNNGIYQVTAIYDGVPGDSLPNANDGGQIYQFIEVVPELKVYGPYNYTIDNITDILPVLHIKYRET